VWAGTYNPTAGASSSSACRQCPPGTASPVPGQSHVAVCNDCLAGSIANASGTAVCALCSAGKYQDARGQTACQVCSTGQFCVEGSSAPQPCPAGTHGNMSLPFMSSKSECFVCPPGTSCSVGTLQPAPCAPGSYTAMQRQSECMRCVGGEFQEQSGATACEVCARGSYCPHGAAATALWPGHLFECAQPRACRQLHGLSIWLVMRDRFNGTYAVCAGHHHCAAAAVCVRAVCRWRISGAERRDGLRNVFEW
jgi:hypothetical protein